MRFAFEVDVGLAAYVDRDTVDGAAGEVPRLLPWVVVGDSGAAVAADAEAFTGDHELAGLGLDLGFADQSVAVPEREFARRDSGRVLPSLVEGRREDEVLASGKFLVRHDLLLEHPDPVVDVVEPVVLDVEAVPAET